MNKISNRNDRQEANHLIIFNLKGDFDFLFVYVTMHFRIS